MDDSVWLKDGRDKWKDKRTEVGCLTSTDYINIFQ